MCGAIIMNDVEIVQLLRKMLFYGINMFNGRSILICKDSKNCIRIYNYEIELDYDNNDLPTKLTLRGKDDKGDTRTFTMELTWSTNPLTGNIVLKHVGRWIEIT